MANRRLLTFSLRVILLFVLLVALGLGFLVNSRPYRQARTVARLQEIGGAQISYSGGRLGQEHHSGSWWWHWDRSVNYVYLSEPATEESILLAATFPDLEEFGLYRVPCEESSIRRFRGLSRLTVTDTPVSRQVVRQIAEIPSLRSLDLNSCGLTDEDLVELASAQQLVELRLTGNPLTNGAIPALVCLVELEELWLARASVSDAALPQLARLSKLKDLNLVGTRVSDAGVPVFLDFPNLRDLALGGTQITDRSIPFLRRLAKIEVLTLPHLSPEGEAELRRQLPRCIIHHASP